MALLRSNTRCSVIPVFNGVLMGRINLNVKCPVLLYSNVKLNSYFMNVAKHFTSNFQTQIQNSRRSFTTEKYERFIESNLSDKEIAAYSAFINPKVQSLLEQLTHPDLSATFKPRVSETARPKLELMTDDELKTAVEKAQSIAKIRLKIPPVLPPRKPISEVIHKEPRLEHIDQSDILFVDISYGIPERERVVTVREPSGTLRRSTWDEHSRIINALYYRHLRLPLPPALFSTNNFSKLLDQLEFVYALEMACNQFEPDDPHFIFLCHMVYEAIDKDSHFDKLLSTRHFGGLAFYLARTHRLQRLLAHYLKGNKVQDVLKALSVYEIVHCGYTSFKIHLPDDFSLENIVANIDNFVASQQQHDSRNNELKKSLQLFCENYQEPQAETATSS